MAGSSRTTMAKRQRERARQEKQREKAEKKAQRKLDKKNGVIFPEGDDMDMDGGLDMSDFDDDADEQDGDSAAADSASEPGTAAAPKSSHDS